MTVRDQVVARSWGRCEAMIKISGHKWTRCFRTPIEVHHMLTRSRGGLILDEAGETAHLIALCSSHHRVAHAPGGHEAGLMIDGYVTTGPDGVPVYQGSDQRLWRFAMDVPALPDDLPSDLTSEGLREEA